MKYFCREEGLSEVVGFILILGLLTIAMSMYVVYEVPVQGEMDEIDHMNGIKDRFVDYKISLDSLWVNSLGVENSGSNINFSPYGINLGTSFVMGTGGGYKTGGSGVLPLFFPVPSAGYMTVNQSDGYIKITKNNEVSPIFEKDIGKLSYNSQNNYWLDQEYYYQMGGVFLKQSDGVTARVAPPVSFYGLDGGNKLGVYVTPVSVKCPTFSQSVGGSGPVMADTRYKNEGQYPPGTVSAQSVQIEMTVKDSLEAEVWKKVFQSALWREGIYINSGWYAITYPDSRTVKIDLTGPFTNTDSDIQLSIYNANFSVTLQNVASSLE